VRLWGTTPSRSPSQTRQRHTSKLCRGDGVVAAVSLPSWPGDCLSSGSALVLRLCCSHQSLLQHSRSLSCAVVYAGKELGIWCRLVALPGASYA
jgi:hypothetical protein